MTFTQQKKLAKEILNHLNEGEVIEQSNKDFNILYELFQLHPNKNEKFKNGCIGFTKIKQAQWGNNYSLAVIGNNKEIVSISTSFTLKGNEKDKIIKALRTAIRPEIEKKQSEFIQGLTICEISENIIQSFNDLHIDHNELDFKDIVLEFLKIKNIKLTDIKYHKENTMYYLSDKYFENEFIEFHNNNTTLRFTHKYYNLRK